MKVLLIHPPWMRFFGSCLAVPPMALNFIAAYVRQHLPAIDIDVYNADYAPGAVPSLANDLFTVKHDEYRRRVGDLRDPIYDDVRKVLGDFQPDLVGISSMTATFPAALQVASLVRELLPAARVVMGGKHATALPDLVLRESNIDVVVIGEGEETFCELLQHLDDPGAVPGLAWRDSSGSVRFTVPRPRPVDIDALPLPIFPARASSYDFETGSAPDGFTWSILSARGCPFQCVYCASDSVVRFRSPENVMAEVRAVRQKYGITHFCFEDDTFSLKRARMEDLCRRLGAEGVKWHCNTRVDCLDEEMVTLMKRSGCVQVYLGIETGSPRSMERIRKKIDIPKVEVALQLLKKHKIMACGFFIIGFPWETYRDMKATVELIERLPLDHFQLNLATPLPGTAMFDDLVRAGRIDPARTDWTTFHQGSLVMNYSRYSQKTWESMVQSLQMRVFGHLRKKFFFMTLRRILFEPQTILQKVWSRFWRNPRLLLWFIPGGHEQ